MGQPFVRGRFEALPDVPRLPHPFFQTPLRRVLVHAAGWPPFTATVRVTGNGPPLLLVHGLMTSAYSWRYVLEGLGKHFTLYIPDLPGGGGSDAVADVAYTPAALAQVLLALQRALNIEGCACVANSMGGYLAMVTQLEAPTAFSRLVVVHAPAVPRFRYDALRAAWKVPGTRALFRGLVRWDPERFAFKNVHYWDETLKSLEEAREYAAPLKTDAGLESFRRYLADTMDAGALRAFHRTLVKRKSAGQRWPVPLLLLYARRDPMVPPETGPMLHALIPDATLTILDDASHFAHVDAVERFLPPVLAFLGVNG